jgi:uncharacterized protein (TIGR03437 family)
MRPALLQVTPMLRQRTVLFVVACAVIVCLGSLGSLSQSTLRRVTSTTDEGININPSVSGDGRIVAFETTEDVAGAGGADGFRAIRANISVDPSSFFQIGRTRAVSPAISQDGSRIAFASKDDPLGTNNDGNSEIFLFNGSNLLQLTNTSPGDPANRTINGNFQPSISDDGRFVAFSSNRNITSQNSDGNLEIFVYDSVAATFSQLTNSTGNVGCTDAKFSGNGARVAYIRDNGSTPSAKRDLMIQDRTASVATVLAGQVQALLMTYGRAISDDGARVAYSSETAVNSSQVFFYDGRSGNVIRQVTSLGTRTTEVPLHPTISGDGKRIAFATRRTVTGFSNSDASVELYTYDIPTTSFARVTSAPGEADCFDGSSQTCEVVSSLNDEGSTIVFNFPRALSGPVVSGLENKSEIYATGTAVRPQFGTLTSILNQASLGHEPSSIKAVAPDSIAAAFGTALANTTQQSQKQANGTFPTNVAGTTVTVNGRAAQIFFVSPDRVQLLVPPQTEIGNAEVVITNADGFASRGTVPILRAAPGIFTKTGDGVGEGMILDADTLAQGSFDPTSGNLRLLIFTTGARNALQTTVNIGGRIVNAESVAPSPDMVGLDEVRVRVPSDLRGTGTVSLFITSDGRDSNPVTVTFTGDPSRNVLINEVLADPPTGIAGDANHDGVRDGTQDEFVELVNGTSSELINIGGWTIRTRPVGSSTETTRFTFAGGTSLPAGEAIVVFGGGSFNPSDPIFGCAQVVKTTTSAGLSLTNSGLTILVRDGAGNLISQFSYGGSTGLDGGNAQSLTRSPDVTGAFVQHTAAAGVNGRRFSPGLRTDGTPFGNCPGVLTTVTISPPSAAINPGQTQHFTAQAFDQFGRVFTGVTINFTSDNTSVATVDSVSTNSSTGVATATVTGHNPGTAHITAVATDGSSTVSSPQATLTVNGPSLSINDVSQNEGDSGTTTFTFTVSLSLPAPAPVSFDISTQDGTAMVATNDYVTRSLTSQTIATGQQTYTFDVTVNGDTLVEPTETFLVNITNPVNASIGDGQGAGTIQNDDTPQIVISQVYGGGNNSGATFKNDYIELFNRGTTTVDLAGWSVQQAAAIGTSWSVTALCPSGSCLIAPGKYFLVEEAPSNPTIGADLPPADATGTSNLATGSGKIALVNNSTTLTGSGCPFGASIVDFVGYGTTADCSENSTRAPAHSNTTADFRKSGGCSDTNDNAGDFTVATPNPRNSSSPANDCSTGFRPDITINDVSVSEGNTGTKTVDFTVSLSAPNNSQTVTVNYATADGTATAGLDYQSTSGSVTFNPGETSKPITVTIIGDTTLESNETFFVNLSTPANAAILDAQGQGTITEDDVPPTLSINDVAIAEGDSGTKTFTFTVRLSSPALTGGVTFDIATADNTATVADHDYDSRSLTNQSIAAGQQNYTFDVTVNGDVNIEPNETFFVNVTNINGATAGDTQGQGTILNDDSPVLNINDVAVSEGDAGTKIFTFTISSTLPAPAGGISFDIATADGTSTAASNDYVANSVIGKTIAAGGTSTTFDVTVNGDTLVETNETFFVNITNPSNASIGDGQGQGTIQNDDSANLVISQVYGGGNNSGAIYQNDFVEVFNRGATTVDFAVTPYSVQYAGVGSNFGGSKTDLTSGAIAPGKYFLVKESGGTTNGSPLPAADATGTINLAASSGKVALVAGTTALSASACPGDDGSTPFNPVDATIADFVGYGSTATTSEHCYEGPGPGAAPGNSTADFRKAGGCTDTNDNAADFFVNTPFPRNSSSPANNCAGGIMPSLSINDVQVAEGNSGTATATFTVSLSSAPQAADVTFDIATANGSATTGNNDYVAKTLTAQVIPSGQTTYTFTVTVNGDVNVEPDENFLVNVTNVVGATTADGQGTGTIQNDDQPTLSINDVTMNEGNAGTTTFSFTVSLSASAPSTVTFDIATQDDSATTADNDYAARSLTGQTIAAGNQTYTFDVAVKGDLNIESNEHFFVNVINISGATASDSQGDGNIQNDDSPALTISDVTQAEGNASTSTFTFTVSSSLPAPAGGISFTVNTADGTATAGSDYVAITNASGSISQGNSSTTVSVTVNGDTLVEPNETFFVNLSNPTNATILDGQGLGTITNDDTPQLVISQVYGGGGNASATYTNDFIEIFNRGTTTIDFSVTPYSVQYAAATSNFSTNKTDISLGTLLPGHYFLIQEASGGANGVALPTPDVSGGTINMSATAGKVALVLGTTNLTGSGCPFGGTIVDLLGYGTTANCSETSPIAVSSTNSNARSVIRTNSCTDTNNNSTDFSNPATAPVARNSATTPANCP